VKLDIGLCGGEVGLNDKMPALTKVLADNEIRLKEFSLSYDKIYGEQPELVHYFRGFGDKLELFDFGYSNTEAVTSVLPSLTNSPIKDLYLSYLDGSFKAKGIEELIKFLSAASTL